MCCNKAHQCFITLQTLTSAATVSLPDSARIRNGKVTSIFLRRSGTLTLKTAQGTTVASDAVIGTAHLTLKDLNGNELTSPIPLSSLQRDFNAPEPLHVMYEGIDLMQSTIVLDFAAATATQCIEIIFGLDCAQCKPN